MKVGMLLNTQFRQGVDARTVLPEIIEQVRTARDNGFSSLWFPQHYLTAPLQMFQLTAIMPYLVSEAKGMMIGPDIMVLPLLNPVSVAEEAATLDVLSGGNYVLGVGLGYREQEYEAFGIPMSERAPRFAESIGLIRRLWTEDLVNHSGRFFKVTNAGIGLKPIAKGGPPIWVAGQAEPAVRRAGEIGDGWLIVPSVTLEQIVPAMKVYRDSLRKHGKPEPLECPITRECYIGSSHASAMDECREAMKFKYDAYASWGQHAQRGKSASASFDDFARDRFIIGDAAFVKDEIARYRETLGVNHFIMRLGWPGLPQSSLLRNMRALGKIFA